MIWLSICELVRVTAACTLQPITTDTSWNKWGPATYICIYIYIHVMHQYICICNARDLKNCSNQTSIYAFISFIFKQISPGVSLKHREVEIKGMKADHSWKLVKLFTWDGKDLWVREQSKQHLISHAYLWWKAWNRLANDTRKHHLVEGGKLVRGDPCRLNGFKDVPMIIVRHLVKDLKIFSYQTYVSDRE